MITPFFVMILSQFHRFDHVYPQIQEFLDGLIKGIT